MKNNFFIFLISFIILFNSFVISSYAKPIKTWDPLGTDHSIGETLNLYKQALDFMLTQVGVYFSGTTHQNILNYEAFQNYQKEKDKEGYNDEPWDAPKYFDKTVVRNEDGTFTLSDKLVDDYVEFVQDVIDTKFGYYLVKTAVKQNIPVVVLVHKDLYNKAVDLIENNYEVYLEYSTSKYRGNYISYAPIDSKKSLVLTTSGGPYSSYIFDENWMRDTSSYKNWDYLSKIEENGFKRSSDSVTYFTTVFTSSYEAFSGVFSKDGHYVKVFKNLSTYKEFDVKHQPYYATNHFYEVVNNVDNSSVV